MRVYKQHLPQLGGYLCRGSDVNLERVEKFIQIVGGYEDQIFEARMRKLLKDKRRCGAWLGGRRPEKGSDN